MTDRPEKPKRTETEGPGIQLRRTRENRGLLLHDIAQELHLDEWMLQALEEDDFAALGAPVFAKGHMRKYGSMLGLNTDDLMIAYYRKRGRDDSPPPITAMMAPESPNPRITMQTLGWVLLALAAALVLLLVWFMLNRIGDPQGPAVAPASTSASAQLPNESLTDQLPTQSQVDLPSQETSGQVAASQPQDPNVAQLAPVQQTGANEQASASGNVNSATAAALPEPPPAEPAPVTTNVATVPETISVQLTLSGESWVEVTDSDGKRLVYDMMSAGRTRNVSGRPPIEVFLGNSRSVQVAIDGQFYSIPRRAVRGNTARFVIESDTR